MIPFQTFLERLAPPQPEFNFKATMQSLKSGPQPGLTPSNRWSKFAKAPKESQGSDDSVFSPIPDIFTKVVAAIVASSGGKLKEENRTVDFLHNPSLAPTSAERRNESRPDGYLVLKNRNKEMSKDGKKEDIFWADIALSCEYKRKDGVDDLDDDVRKCLWSLQHVMRDVHRRASFGITIENSTTRVWFCCRSSVVVSEAFDFIYEPENLVKLFAAFAFADQNSLGFDPTIQPVPGSRGQFVITIHPDDDKQNPRRFRTTKILSSYGAEPLRGRGTRVFEAVEIDGNGDPNGSPVVLKDTWVDSDRAREGNILASLHSAANDEDRQLVEKHFLTTICHGDVWTEPDILDDTANALMRGLNIAPGRGSLFKLQQKPFIPNYKPPSGSAGLRATSRVQAPYSHLRYAHKTHYRIVFKEKGITIDRMRSLPDVMTVLNETASALRLLRKLGWVHRDLSIGNILSCDGHAKLADLEYAKRVGDLKSHDMRTGTMHFMSIEVAAHNFLFFPSDPGLSLSELDGFVSAMEQDAGTAQSKVPFSHNHLHDLESLWWVAVWVVFHNYFSDGAPSFTLQDAEAQYKLARTLFPLVLESSARRHSFQTPGSFQHTCNALSRNKKAICVRLDGLRRLLIKHYSAIEAGYPVSVDPNSSNDEIYNGFTQTFSIIQSISGDLALDFIPDIYAKLLKGENSKRARSESTKDRGTAQKNQRT